MQAIASDNTPPIIRITSLNVEGLRAGISADDRQFVSWRGYPEWLITEAD